MNVYSGLYENIRSASYWFNYESTGCSCEALGSELHVDPGRPTTLSRAPDIISIIKDQGYSN